MESLDLKEPLLDKVSLLEIFKQLFKITSSSDDNENERKENLFKTNFQNCEGLFKTLNVYIKNGLNTEDKLDIKNRIQMYGTNEIEEEEVKSFYLFVCESMQDPMIKILFFASIVSLVIGILNQGISTGWMEGIAIFLAVFIVVSINSILNWKKEQQFRQLRIESKLKNVNVKRNGIKKQIDHEKLLVGDLLFIGIGDIMPADGILIEGKALIDESSLNGESDLVKKIHLDKDKICKSLILSGTQIKEGEGLVIICAVGGNSTSGIHRDLTKNTSSEGENLTPLQSQLRELSDKLGYIGWIMAIFVFIIMITKEILWRFISHKEVFNISIVDNFVNAFILSITVIVVAIPEGLPMAVVISLAFTLLKMKEENTFVKHLDATEAMGNVNNILTDKTGTITEGEMTLNKIYIADNVFSARSIVNISIDNKNLLKEVISMNITAHVEKRNGVFEAIGNMTEKALLQFLIDNNLHAATNDTPTYRLPFNSDNKFMVSIYKTVNPNNGIGYKLFIKGAPEKVYEHCTNYLSKNGICKFSQNNKETYMKIQEIFADDCLRTLALGYRDITTQELENAIGKHPEKDIKFFLELINNLTLFCILGIGDSPRKNIETSIDQCASAGVTVRMITGDNLKTAIAIAKRVGIIKTEYEKSSVDRYLALKSSDYRVDSVFGATDDDFIKSPIAIEGAEFLQNSGFQEKKDENGRVNYILIDEEKFKSLVKNLKLIARASPVDKYVLTTGLKKIDENIVAVTGDGTNDAPALKNAHVGLAMGIRGTDIAKDAADIILMDDSFKSVVTAIKYGRNIYDCIRKFLQFQLTTNIVAVFMTLLGGVVLRDAPMNAIQMLWVNLIMDSFASLALATEAPSDVLLKRRPYKKSASIITTSMVINIASQSIYQILVLTFILFDGDAIFNVPSDRELTHYMWDAKHGFHFTIFFDIFVFMQVFNSLNARKLTKHEKNVFVGIFDNYYYITVQVFIVIAQLIIVEIGGKALRVKPLTMVQHAWCFAIASTTLIVGYLVKFLPYEIEEEIRDKKAHLLTKRRTITSRTLPTRKSR